MFKSLQQWHMWQTIKQHRDNKTLIMGVSWYRPGRCFTSVDPVLDRLSQRQINGGRALASFLPPTHPTQGSTSTPVKHPQQELLEKEMHERFGKILKERMTNRYPDWWKVHDKDGNRIWKMSLMDKALLAKWRHFDNLPPDEKLANPQRVGRYAYSKGGNPRREIRKGYRTPL